MSPDGEVRDPHQSASVMEELWLLVLFLGGGGVFSSVDDSASLQAVLDGTDGTGLTLGPGNGMVGLGLAAAQRNKQNNTHTHTHFPLPIPLPEFQE